MEIPNAQGGVNNLDYHVYHYPRPARPLCLENPILVCWKGGCDEETGTVLLPKDGQAQQHRKLLRKLERRRRRCKHVRIEDTNWAFVLNSAHEERGKKTWAHSKRKVREGRNASKVETKNELTHTTNRKCVSPSSGEEEQKPTLVVGQPAEKCVLA